MGEVYENRVAPTTVLFGAQKFTDEEKEKIQAALNKSLKWDQISSRPGGGGKKVHYLSATTVLENANSIFGFNGWESTILHISTDFVEKTQDGRFFVAAVTAIVKVALKDGAGHEDVGYAHLKDKDKGEVLERAKKAAVTDATKRALRLFGSHLGSQMSDKQGIVEIEKQHRQGQRTASASVRARQSPQPRQPATPSAPVSPPAEACRSNMPPAEGRDGQRQGTGKGIIPGDPTPPPGVTPGGGGGAGWPVRVSREGAAPATVTIERGAWPGHDDHLQAQPSREDGPSSREGQGQGQGQRLGPGQALEKQNNQEASLQQPLLVPTPAQPPSPRPSSHQGQAHWRDPGQAAQGQGQGQGSHQSAQMSARLPLQAPRRNKLGQIHPNPMPVPQAHRQGQAQHRKPEVDQGREHDAHQAQAPEGDGPPTSCARVSPRRQGPVASRGSPGRSWSGPVASTNHGSGLDSGPGGGQNPGQKRGGPACSLVSICEDNRDTGGMRRHVGGEGPGVGASGAPLEEVEQICAPAEAENGRPREDEYGGLSQVDESALAEIDTAIQRHANLSAGSADSDGCGMAANGRTKGGNSNSNPQQGQRPEARHSCRQGAKSKGQARSEKHEMERQGLASPSHGSRARSQGMHSMHVPLETGRGQQMEDDGVKGGEGTGHHMRKKLRT